MPTTGTARRATQQRRRKTMPTATAMAMAPLNNVDGNKILVPNNAVANAHGENDGGPKQQWTTTTTCNAAVAAAAASRLSPPSPPRCCCCCCPSVGCWEGETAAAAAAGVAAVNCHCCCSPSDGCRLWRLLGTQERKRRRRMLLLPRCRQQQRQINFPAQMPSALAPKSAAGFLSPSSFSSPPLSSLSNVHDGNGICPWANSLSSSTTMPSCRRRHSSSSHLTTGAIQQQQQKRQHCLNSTNLSASRHQQQHHLGAANKIALPFSNVNGFSSFFYFISTLVPLLFLLLLLPMLPTTPLTPTMALASAVPTGAEKQQQQQQQSHLLLQLHRWRRTAPAFGDDGGGGGTTGGEEADVPKQQQQQQKQHIYNHNNILFRYQCPQGCLCVPDIVDIELLIVSCRWPTLGPQAFERFPRNGTKSLAITCSGSSNGGGGGSSQMDPAREGGRDEWENAGHGVQKQQQQPNAPLLAAPDAFHGFSELRELRIVGCSTPHLASTLFTGAPRLRSLALSQMPALELLDTDFFAQLAQLEKLTLAETGLRELPTDGICHMGQLMVLNLSHNALESARLGIHWSRRPDDEPSTSCQLEQLLMLDLSGNAIPVLNEHDLCPFPVLRQLSLRATGLAEIQPDAFRFSAPAAPLLQHLDLSYNRLQRVPSNVGLPQTLLQLDLARNRLRAIPTAVSQLVALNRLDLSENSIGEGNDDYEGEGEEKQQQGMMPSLQSAGLEHLDLSRNMLHHVPVEIFADAADALRTLRLGANQIKRLEPERMQNLSQLHELDLSHNQLTSLPLAAFAGLNELTLLQLANNSISHVDAEVFQDVDRTLHTLNMAQNLLTELPVAVGRLSRVKRIDMSRNKISKAYKFVLNKLPHLARLDLSQNALESVDSYVFRECDHLQELNLRANRIQAISPDAFEKCSRLKRLDLAENQLNTMGPALAGLSSLRTVNLSGNRLEELNWSHFPVDLLELLTNSNRIKRIGPLVTNSSSNDANANDGDNVDDGGTGAALSILEASGNNNNGRKLKRLELKANKLVRLWSDSLPVGLEELELSDNQLTLMANSTFHGMTQLKMVNLRHNNLRTIPRELYEQTVGGNAPFGRMWIAGNQLECNCEMGWLLNATMAMATTTNGGVSIGQQQQTGNGIGTTTTTIVGGGGGIRDIAEVECLVPLSADRKLVRQTTASDFLCPYVQFCSKGCGCCEFWKCDCKSQCPKGCTCFRDRNGATNVVKCGTGEAGGVDQQQRKEEEWNLDFKEFPMEASHILISGLNIPKLRENDFAGRQRLIELHINASRVRHIQPLAFNTLINLKSLHLADNLLTMNSFLEEMENGTKKEKQEYHFLHQTPNIRQLNLANNALNESDTELEKIIPKLQQLEQLNLDGNVFLELPLYLKGSSGNRRLQQITLGGNPFRCNCSHTGRYDTPRWLAENRQRVPDAKWVQCVENVTRAKLENDTTVLSAYLPNVGEDLYMFPMLEFFNEENRTICVVPSNGLFGIIGSWNTLLFFTLIILSVVLIIMSIMFLQSCGFIAKSGGRKSRSSNEETIKFLQNNSPTSTTNGGSPLPGSVVDVPPTLPEECHLFVCYSKKDEQLMRKFFRPMEMQGYTVCYLHGCGLYREDMYNLKLSYLLRKSGMIIIYLSHDFLRTVWNQPQFEWFQSQSTLTYNTDEELKDKQKYIILSDKIKEELQTQSNDTAIGKFVRSHGSCRTLDTPFVREDIVRWLTPERPPSMNSHIYSEYGQIQSEFV